MRNCLCRGGSDQFDRGVAAPSHGAWTLADPALLVCVKETQTELILGASLLIKIPQIVISIYFALAVWLGKSDEIHKTCLCFRELDKNAMPVSTANIPLSLGNLGLLMADPTIDRTSLHSHIMQTYKWSSQVNFVASAFCFGIDGTFSILTC